ncbi:hypothetical protein L6452_16720 [Arctium lappa]|uniref:Uncharacterized protein n=1 Tax=Arctium lappa TaxID=4217 RepID=A0ACB9C192_ARCLA|nr:hypothetical protein L6452_16720 [Arctium lappa]
MPRWFRGAGRPFNARSRVFNILGWRLLSLFPFGPKHSSTTVMSRSTIARSTLVFDAIKKNSVLEVQEGSSTMSYDGSLLLGLGCMKFEIRLLL